MTAESSTATAAPDHNFVSGAVSAIKLKGLKYAGVSVFNVILGAGLLFVFSRLFSATDNALPESTRVLRGAFANTLSVVISAVPAYYLSRRWVWGKRGKSELKREVLPFWIFVGLGWFFSTVGVGLVVHYFPAPREAGLLDPNKLAVNVASLVAFGVLWVIRFFWMDKAFHLDHHHAHGPMDVLLDEDELVEPDPVG